MQGPHISPNTIIAATNTTSTNNWITEYFPLTQRVTRNSNNKIDSVKQKEFTHRSTSSSANKNFAAISITSDNNIPILYNFIIKNLFSQNSHCKVNMDNNNYTNF